MWNPSQLIYIDIVAGRRRKGKRGTGKSGKCSIAFRQKKLYNNAGTAKRRAGKGVPPTTAEP